MLKTTFSAGAGSSLLRFLFAYIILCPAILLFLPRLLHQTDYSQGAFVVFSMGELVLVLFFIPLLAVNRMDSARRSSMMQFVSARASLTQISWELWRFPLLAALVFCLAPALSGLFLRRYIGDPPAAVILKTFIIMTAIALAALALGFYASIICRNTLSAAGLALLIILLICTEPVWLGPVISRADMPALIQISLLINPFTGVAASLDFDILRIDPFYELCPIGQLRFQYQAYWQTILFHLCVALILFQRFLAGIRRMLVPSV